jgi:ABC-type nitrate/sulfonate/bicarbonate transport system substrate-binding protein
MTSRRRIVAVVVLAGLLAATPLAARAQDPLRSPLKEPVKVKQGMLNVPALSPLYLLPDEAKPYNIQIEQVMFQRFADERTALASGDLDIAAFGPQDISLAASQGVKNLVGVAGVGSGNDCLSSARARTSRPGPSSSARASAWARGRSRG